MTFAHLLLEIRRRAATFHDDGRRPEVIERIARDILTEIPEGTQTEQVRHLLASFLGLGEGGEFDAVLLDQMTPELVLRLDMMLAGLLEFGRTQEEVRALRGVLIRPVQ